MLEKKRYANGQAVYLLAGGRLTYFFKDGGVKAAGGYVNGQMEDDWVFFRESGQLWQMGGFRNGQKHGKWVRLSRDGVLESEQEFVNGEPHG